jgi:hypothetical protein
MADHEDGEEQMEPFQQAAYDGDLAEVDRMLAEDGTLLNRLDRTATRPSPWRRGVGGTRWCCG